MNDREYSYEGLVTIHKPSAGEYHALLFNDVIVIAKKRRERENRITAQTLLYLSGILIYDLVDVDGMI